MKNPQVNTKQERQTWISVSSLVERSCSVRLKSHLHRILDNTLNGIPSRLAATAPHLNWGVNDASRLFHASHEPPFSAYYSLFRILTSSFIPPLLTSILHQIRYAISPHF